MREILAFYIGLTVLIISLCAIAILTYVYLGDSLIVQITRGSILGISSAYASSGLASWVYNKLKD